MLRAREASVSRESDDLVARDEDGQKVESVSDPAKPTGAA